MHTHDDLLLEQAYQQILHQQVQEQLHRELEELLQEGPKEWVASVLQPAKDLFTVGLQDINAYVAKIGALGKAVVGWGAGSSAAIYILGSVLKYLGTKRQEANKLTNDKILSIATANSKPQIEALINAYNSAASDAERNAIVQRQNEMLKQAIKNVEQQMKSEKKSTIITNLLTSLGGLLQGNSFMLGLLATATLSHFGIITFPSLKL